MLHQTGIIRTLSSSVTRSDFLFISTMNGTGDADRLGSGDFSPDPFMCIYSDHYSLPPCVASCRFTAFLFLLSSAKAVSLALPSSISYIFRIAGRKILARSLIISSGILHSPRTFEISLQASDKALRIFCHSTGGVCQHTAAAVAAARKRGENIFFPPRAGRSSRTQVTFRPLNPLVTENLQIILLTALDKYTHWVYYMNEVILWTFVK